MFLCHTLGYGLPGLAQAVLVSQCHADALEPATPYSAASMRTHYPHCSRVSAASSCRAVVRGGSLLTCLSVCEQLLPRVLLLATEDVQSKASLLGKINPNGAGKYALPLGGDVQSPLDEQMGAGTDRSAGTVTADVEYGCLDVVKFLSLPGCSLRPPVLMLSELYMTVF